MVNKGDAVKFFDPYGVEHAALITEVFDGGNQGDIPNPSVNLVYASSDETKRDQYGRQLERNTSVVHKSNQYAHGMYWEPLGE